MLIKLHSAAIEDCDLKNKLLPELVLNLYNDFY